MVGALNRLPIAVSGLLFFSASVTFESASAIIIGFISGIVHSWAEVIQAQMDKMSFPTARTAVEHKSIKHPFSR
jgi:GDP-mannose transporter